MVSEEHDTKKLDIQTITEPQKNLAAVSSLPGDEVVPIQSTAVWIDPLDATQEYTGMALFSFI